MRFIGQANGDDLKYHPYFDTLECTGLVSQQEREERINCWNDTEKHSLEERLRAYGTLTNYSGTTVKMRTFPCSGFSIEKGNLSECTCGNTFH